jgi:polyisoprenoid-binding protein YceI
MPDSRRSFPRPRSAMGWVLTTLAGVVAVGAAGVLFVYFVLFSHSAPPPLALTSPSGAAAASASPALTATDIPGAWTVASRSVAGYRVREQLAFVQAPSDAVGRTSQITGSVTIAGSSSALSVSAASFTVNVQSLTSDQQMRDSRLQAIGIESAQFPKATFVLSSPVTLPADAASGVEIHVSLTGALTIHGTTRTETIPVQARLSGSEIDVVGSITFPWADFNMQAPNIAGFVTVDNTATMEFDLFLKRG